MLIGLHGKKQAGKDTVCERLAFKLDVAPVERVSFADKLYESAAAALGISVDFLRRWKSDPHASVDITTYGNVRKRQTFREFLQSYGTEAHRDLFGPDFWVDNVDLSHEGRIVVVTDVRFTNEAQAVIDAGGAVVHVVGPPEVEDVGDGHASEEKLPDRYLDFVLPNDVRWDGFANLDMRVVELFLRLRREGF